MTFEELLAKLAPLNQNAPLVFVADGREIGPGCHVTELRHSVSTGIDCGGTVSQWDEARLQLLDGPGQTHMTVTKFQRILAAALEKLPVLADTPFVVEFGPDNAGLALMMPDAPQSHDAKVLLSLRHAHAVCKPALQEQTTGLCYAADRKTDAAACC